MIFGKADDRSKVTVKMSILFSVLISLRRNLHLSHQPYMQNNMALHVMFTNNEDNIISIKQNTYCLHGLHTVIS